MGIKFDGEKAPALYNYHTGVQYLVEDRFKPALSFLNKISHSEGLIDNLRQLGLELMKIYGSPDLISQVSRVYIYGAKKYGRDNFQGIELKRYGHALARHMNAMFGGVECDDESGLPHIIHSMANVLIMLEILSVGDDQTIGDIFND